jgi:hypothetical protein
VDSPVDDRVVEPRCTNHPGPRSRRPCLRVGAGRWPRRASPGSRRARVLVPGFRNQVA